MIVVSDASPIIALEAIGRLAMLQSLYRDVIIPATVRGEILAAAGGDALLARAPWITMRRASDLAQVRAFEDELDPGEAEAIALALELSAEVLLIDERRGRSVALGAGLRVVGVVGVVLEAKAQGLIAAVRPILLDLVQRAGLWVGDDVLRRVLEAAGEEP